MQATQYSIRKYTQQRRVNGLADAPNPKLQKIIEQENYWTSLVRVFTSDKSSVDHPLPEKGF